MAAPMTTTLDEFEAEYRKGIGCRMPARVRHPNVVGDTNTVFGKVARKSTVDGENLVELEVYKANQAGLATAESTISAALGRRTA